jgi:hypothetical protein
MWPRGCFPKRSSALILGILPPDWGHPPGRYARGAFEIGGAQKAHRKKTQRLRRILPKPQIIRS